jgi:UPF0755 protein
MTEALWLGLATVLWYGATVPLYLRRMSRVWAVLTALIAATAGAGGSLWWLNRPPGAALPHEFVIPKGITAVEIADRLHALGLIRSPRFFRTLSAVRGLDIRLEAGRFRLERGLSTGALVERLTRADPPIAYQVTLPEGLRASEIAGLLSRKAAIDSAGFMAAVTDSARARALGSPVGSLEGYLFPETYRIDAGTTPAQVAAVLVEQFWRVFDDAMRDRARAAGLMPHQALTLASIIEREVRLGEERPIVASVFHNRLRRGMKLEACPTIEYLFGRPMSRLSAAERNVDSPYNTYRYRGLPPGPICNPGAASLHAAAAPASTDFLFFVAAGDGSHIFSRTLAQHLRAINAIQRRRG